MKEKVDNDENEDMGFVVLSHTVASWITKQKAVFTSDILCATAAELCDDLVKQGTLANGAADA